MNELYCKSFSTLWDAVPHDFDIIITVCPGLLMPETKSMKELMFNGGNAVTVSANGQSLFPNSTISHGGETSVRTESHWSISVTVITHTLIPEKETISTSFSTHYKKHVIPALPAPFKDGNVICFSVPRLEVNAGLEPVLLKGLQNNTFCIDLCKDDTSIVIVLFIYSNAF